MQNFRTLGLIIKKVRNLFNLSDKYGKIIQCANLTAIDAATITNEVCYGEIKSDGPKVDL